MSARICSVVPVLRHASRTRGCVPSVGGVRHMRRWWGDPFAEVQKTFEQFERQMRQMDRVVSELERASPFRLAPWSFLGSRHRDVPVESSGNDKYRLEINLPDFQPEEVKVTIKDRLLSIRAKKDVKNEDGSHYVREYHHEYTLPHEVDPETVRSLLEPDGTLKIEAPLQAIEPPKATEIPVEKADSEGGKKT